MFWRVIQRRRETPEPHRAPRHPRGLRTSRSSRWTISHRPALGNRQRNPAETAGFHV